MVDSKKIFKGLIMLFIMLGIGWIPAPAPMEQVGMKILGIFLGMIFGWIFIEIGSVSIIGLVMFVLTGCGDMTSALVGSFGTQLMMMLIAIFFLVAYAQDQKLGDFVADWMMHRKALSGRPYLFFFVFLIASFLVSLVSNAFGAFYIMLAIYKTINETANFRINSKENALFILGILIATLLAEISLPVKTTAAMYIGFYSSLTGSVFNGLFYTVAMVPICFAFIAIYTLICKFVFRPDFIQLVHAIDSLAEKPALKITKEQKRSIFVIIVFMLCLMLPGISLPFGFWSIIQGLGTGGMSLVCMSIFYFLTINGKPIFNLQALAKDFMWDALFMACTISYIVGQLTSSNTGIQDFLQITLYPILEGLGPVTLIIALIILTVLLTNFINNFVAGSLMISFASILVPAFPSLSIQSLFIILTIASMTAFGLPSACPNTAIAFGLKEYVSFKQMIGYGLFVTAILAIFLCIAVWPFVNLIF